MYLAQNLKYLRERSGEKQKNIAGLLSVAQRTVSKYENSECEPDIEKLILFADHFGVTIDDLLRKDLCPSKPVYASNLKYFREKHGMKQEDIADLLEVSLFNACKYENGKIYPTVIQLMKLADFFGVTLDQMVKQDLSKEV